MQTDILHIHSHLAIQVFTVKTHIRIRLHLQQGIVARHVYSSKSGFQSGCQVDAGDIPVSVL